MKTSALHTFLRSLFTIAFCVMLFSSCGTKRKATTRKPSFTPTHSVVKETKKQVGISASDQKPVSSTPKASELPNFKSPVEAYIWKYSNLAQEEMRLYGIPASITIAQGILESGSGKGDLTMRSNNHFGIKCNGWEGAKVYHDDDELQECFRKYVDAKYSFRDHSLFLYERPRYAFLFDYEVTDYKAWARGLRRAGYATDRKYPDKLISLIERYYLYELDNEVVNGTPPPHFPEPKNKVDNSSTTYIVQAGDTLYKIASKFNLTVEELKQINRLRGDVIYTGQKLQLKK